jgi:hypothetical protein
MMIGWLYDELALLAIAPLYKVEYREDSISIPLKEQTLTSGDQKVQ